MSPRPRLLPRLEIVVRDGARLCTDVYLPVDTEPRPTVVVRTPYGRGRPFLMLLAQRLSAAGMAVVCQDCRGRYQSTGEFSLELEEQDAYDTLLWLREQEWSNGRVALVGISIGSYSNFRTAAGAAPAGIEIAAVVAFMGVLDCHSLFYRGGALVLHWALPWSTLMDRRHNGRTHWMSLPWRDIFGQLPLENLIDATEGHTEIWKRAVREPWRGGGWEKLTALDRLDRITCPVLFLAGWLDFLLMQMIQGQAGTTNSANQLVVGPWDHQTLFGALASPTARAESSGFNLNALVVGWLGRQLLGTEFTGGSLPPVVLHLAGEESWVAGDRFPPEGVVFEPWFLASADETTGTETRGCLLPAAPERLGRDVFDYDPLNPVPTLSGAVWPFDAIALRPGREDQRAVESRPDVLLYSSAALEGDLVVIGPIVVKLWIASSAPDTDFTAKLVDVHPDGSARIVQDGIARTRWREGPTECWLEVHQPTPLTIALEAVAYRFAAGHRLRLEISSSNFPKFDRNLNSRAPAYLAKDSVVAQQSIFTGGTMASHLLLPRISEANLARIRWRPPAWMW